jgi:tetratricopeptide (TPR) repeat protein
MRLFGLSFERAREQNRTRPTVKALVPWLLVAALVGGSSTACSRSARHAEPALSELRERAPARPELAADWLAAELLAPGGDAKQAERARKALDDSKSTGLISHLVRGVDDSLHGRLATAPEHYLRAAEAARTSTDPRAPLVAWYAVDRALESSRAHELWKTWKPFAEKALADPGNLGWRARIELVDWWISETWRGAGKNVDDLAVEQLGCATQVRFAGPFGIGSRAELTRSHAAEAPGPWPVRWQPEPGVGIPPRILSTKQRGCFAYVDEPIHDGVFYAESFVELDHPERVLLAAQGALALWINDHLVLDRDPRFWGAWPKFGVEVELPRGRHRVLVRLDSPRTSLRFMHPDGRPLRVRTDADARAPYALRAPVVTGEPNVVSRYVVKDGVAPIPDLLTRFLVASLAHQEAQGDVASVAFQPLVAKLDQATGPALLFAAEFAERDPVYGGSQLQDLARQLQQRALKRDPGLWRARLALARADAERIGPSAAAKKLEAVAKNYPDVVVVQLALAEYYSELGWSAEYSNKVLELARRFPDDRRVIGAALDVYDAQGKRREADAAAQRLQELEPDGEVQLTRALAREDYTAALAELKKLAARRPEREDLAERMYDVMVRAGNTAETWNKLEAAIEKAPRSGPPRLALADAQFASGKRDALVRALVDAIQKGAGTGELAEAIDLVEGTTELEPYRLKAEPIIRAYETSGKELPGHAARILDYSAVWVKADGSSRMLEHEIVRIQSQEAISKFAEHPVLRGVPLHMRVLKKDGRVLEPEFVAGKPTVTLPHLEIGDYLETEHVTSSPGDGQRGTLYEGPQWFFREENVAYARSEFVVISPKDKPLVIETHNAVPAPEVEDLGALVLRRWRVLESPAAPSEPFSPPMTEFLPSVRIGWGVDLATRLRQYSDLAIDLTPKDPRIAEIAERIVKGVPASQTTERARRLYRWVLDNVEEGNDADGRRVIVGRQGQRARGFETLCRALGIKVSYAIARNSLAPEPTGPMERAMLYNQLLMQVSGERGPVWLTVGNKFAPFGYVPAEVRGAAGFLLVGKEPKPITVPSEGSLDGFEYEGEVVLRPSGSARIELVQRFLGSHAVAARSQLAQLPESRLPDAMQGLAGQLMRGSRLVSHEILRLDDYDSPLAIRLVLDVDAFAQKEGNGQVIVPPFPVQLGGLATLPERQTAILIGQATHRRVKLKVRLPEGTRVSTTLSPTTLKHKSIVVHVLDRTDGGELVLERRVTIPASRIAPSDYGAFVSFARQVDDAQNAAVRLKREGR